MAWVVSQLLRAREQEKRGGKGIKGGEAAGERGSNGFLVETRA